MLEAILDPAPFHPDTLPHPEGGRFMVLFSPPSKESKLEVPHTGLVFPWVSGVEPCLIKDHVGDYPMQEATYTLKMSV